jgi:endonuclease/exonuclease/phosphatase family metal-dependent hydrolase
MLFKSQVVRCARRMLLLGAVFFSASAFAQSNINVRVMAANISSGTQQAYEAPGIRIFQGLKPDVVAIQEFNYAGNTAAEIRSFIDTAFGTNYSYYRESGSFQIPNGIISRWAIIQSGSWPDSVVNNRSFAWARIDVPGTNDLYFVSVHLLNSGTATDRNTEANEINSNIAANFPAGAWVIVGGDLNVSSRTEAAVNTFKTILSDNPIPTDLTSGGNPDTNEPRNKPYDYVLPSFSLTNCQVPVVIGANTFPNGLVFDSTVFANNYTLAAVSPVQSGDSHGTGMQHMGVVKDFLIPVSGTTNPPATNPPAITTQPQSQAVSPGSNVTFTVTASGTEPLSYQWLFNGTNISGATTNPFTVNNAQPTNAGNYSVTVTNIAGSVTSSIAVLTVSNFPPVILTQPQSQTVSVGASPTFTVVATGTAPLSYQWVSGATNIPGANTYFYTRSNVQTNDAGNYSVVVTNIAGSVTSSVATLTILVTNPVPFAQWNFNSVPADGSVNTGSTSPSVGSGTAAVVGGITASFIGGDPALDPAPADNTAWTTTTYPSSTVNNKSAGVQFSVSTAGKQNIIISWSQRSSSTGSKYFRLQYSTNNGAGFADFPASVTVATSFTAFTNDLSMLPGVDNNSNFVFRIVAEFQSTATGSNSAAYAAANAPTSTYASTGTSRFDMVTVSGTGIIINSTPAAAAVLSAPGFSAGQFQMLVTGTAGSNYVVQVTTNLSPANWVGQLTNTSPFTFTDTNLTGPQKFYRAIVQP